MTDKIKEVRLDYMGSKHNRMVPGRKRLYELFETVNRLHSDYFQNPVPKS